MRHAKQSAQSDPARSRVGSSALVRPVRLVRFRPGTDFDGLGWHVANCPGGDDRTLCGLALEGIGDVTLLNPTEEKIGQPTCKQCRAIISYVASILPNREAQTPR